MELWQIILAALLKIGFIIAVVVGAFAPVLVWAERRQSAMMQDRVGPHRAALTLPGWAVDLVDSTVRPLFAGAVLCGLVAALAGFGIFWEFVFSTEADSTFMGVSHEGLYILGAVATAVAGALFVGHKVHAGLVDAGGKVRIIGLLHPLADALKMIWKEDFVPPKADKFLHAIAPIITVIPAVLTFAVIPFSDTLFLDYLTDVVPRDGVIQGATVPMQVANLNVGILFIFAVAGTGVIGAAVGGYASDNKFSLLGGIRAASQMVSYEVALGLTLVPCFMIYDTLRLEEMVMWQHTHSFVPGFAGTWGIFLPPLTIGFILYLTAAIAETKRVPFDLPEGESELVGGYLTEYSGMKFGMFFTGEFVEVVALAAIAAIIFFGGWDVPFLFRSGFDLPGEWAFTVPLTDWVIADQILLQHWFVVVIQLVAFLGKIIALIFFQLTLRWSLPRFRYDQVMALCWKGLLPLSLVLILITGIGILVLNQ